MMIHNIKLIFHSAFVVMLFAFFLTGCVTTETGVFTAKVDDKKSLANSVSLAKQYMSERKWAPAKRHLKMALALDDDSAEVHEAMALVFQKTGEFERAEQHYKVAIKLDAKFSRVRLNYASYLYNLQRFGDAAKQLERVVKDTLYEGRQSAFVSLGRCYYKLEKYQKAEKSFKTAFLMRDRHHPNIILIMADVYYQLADYAESQRFYDVYSGRVKTKSASALLLGVRLAKQFADKDAFSSYALALKNLYPRSQQLLDYRKEFAYGN